MRRPGRGGDEIAVGNGIGHGEVDVGAAGLGNIGADRGISAALFPLKDAGSGENLCGVTDGSDGLICL